MDIVLKYNDEMYGNSTVDEHRQILKNKNKVVWGIIKPKENSPGIGKDKKKQIRKQLKRNIPTYAYLATGGKIYHQCTISAIYEKEDVYNKQDLVPKYYRKDINTCVLGVEISEIKKVPPNIIDSIQRYGGGDVALGNQTNPLYVENVEGEEQMEQEDIIDKNSISINPNTMLTHINDYIHAKGFIFSKQDISNLYISLKTKPFVLLAGISGTGKSKLVQLFAEAIGANSSNGRYNLISVKPDWNDGTDLFGYIDINGEYKAGILSEIVYQANKPENLDKPYIICLDEMNLARVEYYLSDYLSIIETRENEDGKIKTSNIFSKGYLPEDNKYGGIFFSDNINIIGTVNMDDTTFSFSEKVLDRANTIEFSKVDLGALDFSTREVNPKTLDNNNFKTSYLTIKDALEGDRDYVETVNNQVIEINNILQKYNKHFGYRIRDEIVFYMLENHQHNILSNHAAFDYQVLQKILPKISGSDREVKLMLIDLNNYLNMDGQIHDSINYIESIDIENSRYPKSTKKIKNMLRSYENGYTSFW